MNMYPDNRQTNQQPQHPSYDSGDDQADFQGTLLDPYWGNQGAYRQQYASQEGGRSRMVWVAAALGVVALGFTAVFAFSGSKSGEVPVISADATPYKTKPANPGGIEIPFQDKLVFNRLSPEGTPVQAERLLPPAEQPMELALQPDMKKPATPANAPLPMASEKSPLSDAIAKQKGVPVDVEKVAPTEGAVPAPVNDNIPQEIKEIQPPKAAPVESVTKAAPIPFEPKAETKVVEAPKAAAPAPVATPKVETPIAAAPKVEKTPAVSGGTRVQLASIPDKTAAEKALSKLQAQYGSPNGATLSLVKADIPGKGTYYRVQSQPMDKSAAQKMCDSVKSSGGVCIFAK